MTHLKLSSFMLWIFSIFLTAPVFAYAPPSVLSDKNLDPKLITHAAVQKNKHVLSTKTEIAPKQMVKHLLKRHPTANKKSSKSNKVKKHHLLSKKGRASILKSHPLPKKKHSGKKGHRLTLNSNAALIINPHTGKILFEKNSDQVMPIASITKLMTAMVILDAVLPPNDILEITEDDVDYERNSLSRLKVGVKLTRKDLLHLALMSSENRAASALSRYYPGGKDAFIQAMNQKAKKLGMEDTYFYDATGLSSQNVSSARNLVTMIEVASRYPLIRYYSTDLHYKIDTPNGELLYKSTNHLVKRAGWNIEIQKTGFINEAGRCLVMQASFKKTPFIIVLLNASNNNTRTADAVQIRQWLLKNQYPEKFKLQVKHEITALGSIPKI